MNHFDPDTFVEAMEVWPVAPLKAAALDKAQPVPRPPLWLQVSAGFAAGFLFVPVVWVCLLLPFSRVAFLAALAVSIVAWRHYRAFAVTFAAVSAGTALFAWVISVWGNMAPAY